MQQTDLPLMSDRSSPRASLEARWLALMRDVLPKMAKRCGWPISRDHCFMRVCLDISLGRPWTTVVKPPAIRHMTNEQLIAAIAVAEAVVHAPETLHALNRRSISERRRLRNID